MGFVFGALGIGFIADAFNLNIAIQIVAWISLGSGIFVLLIMRETRMTGIRTSKRIAKAMAAINCHPKLKLFILSYPNRAVFNLTGCLVCPQ